FFRRHGRWRAPVPRPAGRRLLRPHRLRGRHRQRPHLPLPPQHGLRVGIRPPKGSFNAEGAADAQEPAAPSASVGFRNTGVMLRSIQRSIQPLFFSLLAALLALPAASNGAAQTIPPKGTGATFDVATWNIEWFGGGPGPSDNERQLDNVEAVIEASQIDLWALQE